MIETIGSFVTILIVVFCLAYLISNINYLIDEQYLRIRVGAFTFRKILVSDFEGAEVGVTEGGENWTNTIHMPTIREKGVTLYRKTGFFRRLNITPEDPVGFVKKIKSHSRYRPSR